MSRARLPLVFAALAALAPLAARAADPTCPARAWDVSQWPEACDRQADGSCLPPAKSAEIEALEAYAFTLTGAEGERAGLRTDSVLIIQGGELVYERYARGWTASNRHLTWSVAKSVSNAITGVAVHQGALTLDDSICDHLSIASPEACGVSVQNLLEFASGFDWKEIYEDESNQESSVIGMLYGIGRRDMVDFVTGHPLRDPPGTSYQYSTGDAVVLGSLAERALLADHGPDPFETLLFAPLGIEGAVWERDNAGNLAGGSYLYMTSRDFARFGWLFVNDGCVDGVRLLPEGWVEASNTVSQAYINKRVEFEFPFRQGRQFWLNKPVPELGFEKAYPDLPEDAFFALGHWGQSITIIPSLDMVIVRTADDREKVFDRNEFSRLSIAVGSP